MKKNAIACALLCLAAGTCAAWDQSRAPVFRVIRVPLGSGTPAQGMTTGVQAARLVAADLYHVPNYLPGHPTAATIWPREVVTECERDASDGGLDCDGYDVHPALGRGEYIYVRPVVRPEPPPPEPPPPAWPDGELIIVMPPCCDCEPRPAPPKRLRG